MLTILPKAHPVSFFQSLIPKLSRLLSFVYMIRIVELIVDRNCKSFTTFSYLNNAQFRKGSEAAQKANAATSSEMRRTTELIQDRNLGKVSTASGQKRTLRFVFSLAPKI
jgi:hypothetical protein